MTYLVVDNCIKCKYTDCVAVCPVDCFYEGDDMLVIDPEECIDCGVCVDECPANAIIEDKDDDADGKWTKINAHYSKIWKNITKVKPPLPDAKKWDGVKNKYEKFFKDLK